MGAGRLEVETEGGSDELHPGDLLFAAQVLAAGAAPQTVKANEMGAVILQADRKIAHELMVSVPPLLEILAG